MRSAKAVQTTASATTETMVSGETEETVGALNAALGAKMPR